MKTVILSTGLIAAATTSFAQPGPSWNWDIDGDLEGWGREHSLTPPQVEGGLLKATMTGTDPWIMGPSISVRAEDYPFLRLRIRVDHWAGGGIYWQTADEPEFAQERLVSFRLTSDTEFSDLLIDLREHPEWRGTITQLRLDPLDVYPSAVRDFLIEIDSLAFLADAERPPEVVAGQLVGPRQAVVPVGEPFEVGMTIENIGGQTAEGMYGIVLAPEGMARIAPAGIVPDALAPGESAMLKVTVTPRKPGPVPIAATVKLENHVPVYGALRCWAEGDGEVEETASVSLGDRRLVTEKRDGVWGPLRLGPLTIPTTVTIFHVSEGGTLEVWEPAPESVRTPDGEFVAEASDEVAASQLGFTKLGPDTLQLRCEVRTKEPLQMLACWGPTLIIEGTEKDDAIFPGLEWLTAEEFSSSDLDCHTEDRIRYVPHPNKVTVPAMAVRVGGTMYGLLWEPMQPWMGERTRPSAVFAVPNTLEQRDNHLMALMAPSIPDAMLENATLASEPVMLPPGRSLSLVAHLVAREAETSGEVVTDWVDALHLPEPAPTKHDTLMDAFEFTLHGYLDALWVEEESGWLNGLGPPSKAQPYYPFMRDMTVAGRVLPEGKLRDRVREQVALARGDVQGNFGIETAVYDGGLIPLVSRRMRAGVQRLIQQQDADGGWGYQPGPPKADGKHDPRDLGEAGEVELGTCARNALTLLRQARFAQDEEALQAGLRALERMREFGVPRAAQVWEVPVHTPDVLAAAQAVRAYVEGTRATGDEQWIADAVRWAKLGLPFIYLWDSGELDSMRYGSIPVFGATWFTGSWFGRLVQWNGSDYAAALLELAPYDDSMDWPKIAEGLSASASNQQAHEGPQRGLYTDATNLMNGSVADFWVAPYHHCESLLGLMGVPVSPVTATVDVAGETLAITSAGAVIGATHADGVLTFTCAFPDAGRHFVLLANCPPPASVAANGDPVPFQVDPTARMVEVTIDRGRTIEVLVRLGDG